MAGALFRVLVILLGLSHLLCLNAVPVTRTGSLMDERQLHQVQQDTLPVSAEKNLEAELINERMAVEINDYPGSGANNRHTPRPQLGRGCTEC